MRKSLLILFIAITFLTGCTITKVNGNDYDKLINNILSFDIKMLNKIGSGYKYYTPKGVIRTYSNTYNDVLKRDNTNYYLFVDLVGYYYKNKIDYNVNKKAYYSSLIGKGKNKGYVEILEKKGKLYVKMNYNYGKIETYTDKKNLTQTLTDMSYILSSIEFNDSLLKKMYESGNLSAKEEVYKLFENKGKEGNFLEYIKEYDKYDGTSKEEPAKEKEIKQEESKTTQDTSKTTTKEQTSTSDVTTTE